MKYEGYNGQIEVRDDELVITRNGLKARAAFGRNTPERRIPLQAVSGVRLKEATRLKNGWVQLLLVGESTEELSVGTAARNANTVLFTHGKDDQFSELHERLAAIAAGNPDAGPGVSQVHSGQENAIEEGGALATPQLDDQYIQAADYEKLKKKVKSALEQNLHTDETIRVIIRGAHGQAMVGTDNRVFVCKPGFMAGASFGAEVTSWGYQNLLGVQVHKGLMSGSVVLQGPGQSGQKTSYWGGDKDDPAKAPNAIPVVGDWDHVNGGAARLRQMIDDAHKTPGSPTTTTTTESATSVADELRKLADLRNDGILSEEEFEAQKARLLGA